MCEWKSKYVSPPYECKENPLHKDPKGYCLLHSRNDNKDLEAFKQKVAKRMQAPGKIDLKGCYFPKSFPADYFEDRTFDRPVNFLEAAFWVANFSGATFSQEANFFKTKFSKEADFSGATFLQVDFSGAEFSKDALFLSAKFSWAYFSFAKFSQKALFSCAIFSQGADFSGAQFSRANFPWAEFSQVNFSKANFTQAYFTEATFSQEADFSGTVFSENAHFSKVKFKEADFSGIHFKKGAIFSYAEFQDRVLFLPREIGEEEDKKKVKKLRRVILGPSKFHHTRFLGEAIFQDVNLSQCSFLNSNIDKVDFRYCKFGEVKEQLLGIIPSPRRNVLKDEIDVDEDVNKKKEDYEPVHRLYQELKKNFEEKKDWNMAGDFHYGEMECRRKMKGALGREFFSLEALYRRASGYGERPWRAGFWLGTLILSFTLFYLPPTGKVSPSPKVLSEAGQALLGTDPQGTSATTTKEAFQAQSPKERDIQSPGEATSKFERYQVWFKRYLEGLNTSLRVTARLDTKETGWPRTIQSILGPILIALFALALRRKVKR